MFKLPKQPARVVASRRLVYVLASVFLTLGLSDMGMLHVKKWHTTYFGISDESLGSAGLEIYLRQLDIIGLLMIVMGLTLVALARPFSQGHLASRWAVGILVFLPFSSLYFMTWSKTGESFLSIPGLVFVLALSAFSLSHKSSPQEN